MSAVTAYGFVRVRHDSTGDTAFERYVLPEIELCRRCGMEAETGAQIKAVLAAHRPDVPAESIDRLRQFGARLARCEHASEP